MKFSEIQEKVNHHQYLLGEKTSNGLIIDEIVPIPIGHEENFWRHYINELNAERAFALLLFDEGLNPSDLDYSLYVVCDKQRIRKENLLFFQAIEY